MIGGEVDELELGTAQRYKRDATHIYNNKPCAYIIAHPALLLSCTVHDYYSARCA